MKSRSLWSGLFFCRSASLAITRRDGARAYQGAHLQMPPGFYDKMNGIGGMQLPTDEQIFDGYLSDTYRHLCREIITKVVAQARIRTKRVPKPKPAEPDGATAPS